MVMADGSKLMQVVSNLLSDAVKCTDAGEVLITIENKFDTEDRTNKSSNKEVIVSITYRDIISLLGEQTQREIPVYINA
jgi:signal transduction histidine kinase